MSDFDILRDLIRDDALAAVEYQNGKKIIVLKEPGDQQQPEYSLNLRNVPDDIFVFKLAKKKIGIRKRPTRDRPPSGRHDTPERMLKINAPAKGNLRFNYLVGKP